MRAAAASQEDLTIIDRNTVAWEAARGALAADDTDDDDDDVAEDVADNHAQARLLAQAADAAQVIPLRLTPVDIAEGALQVAQEESRRVSATLGAQW